MSPHVLSTLPSPVNVQIAVSDKSIMLSIMEGQSGQKEHLLILINDFLILIYDFLILINDFLI